MGKIKKSGGGQRCRCCLERGALKELWAEYRRGDKREVYGEMLADCFALPWQPPFVKTEHICEGCITSLRDAVGFKKKILYSDEVLTAQVKNESSETVKQEEDSDAEIQTEYLSVDYMDEDLAKEEEDKSIEVKVESDSTPEALLNDNTGVRKRGRRYTEDDFRKCMEAVRSNTLSQTKAAIVYRVPRNVIREALQTLKARDPESQNRDTNIERAKHVDNITTLYHHTNATPIRAKKDIGYGCCFCENFFQKPAELKIHTKLSHRAAKPFMRNRTLKDYHVKLDITDLQCNECNAKIDKLDDMMIHLKEHHKKVIHSDINNHIMPFKFDSGELKCVFCGAEFQKFKTLAEHMNKHYRNCVCEVCGTGFINEKSLYVHRQAHKTGVFPCKFCEKVFDTIVKKKSHESSVHVHSQMLNKCGYCNKKFKSYRRKQKHIASEHGVLPKKYRCKLCERVYLNANALRVHTRRDHLKERTFVCKICDYSSYDRRCLDNHMLKHTGVKDFQCDVCRKFYARKKTLREHMRIHEDDRRFKCELCGVAFIQNCSLKAHLRSKHRDTPLV